VDGQGSARPDHQGEDNTQTHHWQHLWQLTEYNKLQTASGFERTLRSTLHMDTIIVDRFNVRGQIPTLLLWFVLCIIYIIFVFCSILYFLCRRMNAEVVRVYDGNGSLKRRQHRTVTVPKHAPAQVLLVCIHNIQLSSSINK